MSADLARAMSRIAPFSSLGRDALADVAARFRRRSVPAGRALVRQGGDDRSVGIVLRGALEVSVADGSRRGKTVARLGPGEVFGEIALIGGGARTATVRAARASQVAILDVAAFRELLGEHHVLAEFFGEQAHRRLLRSQIPALVARAFGDADDELIADVADVGEWVHLQAGDSLFEQGDQADAAYLIAYGRVALGARDDGTGEIAQFGDAGRGEMVGTAAVADGGPRSASAWAIRDSYLLRISRPSFEQLAERHPGAMLTLTRSQLARVRAPGRRRESEGSVAIAVLAASPGFDVRVFSSALADELGRSARVAHLWSDRIDASLRRAGIAQSVDGIEHVTVTRKLYETEDRHELVLYEADREWSAWTQRVTRQADWIIVVTAPGDPIGDIERRLYESLPAGRRPRVSLVLVRQGGAPPQGTRAALEGRAVDDHFHLRAGHAGDLARLGRILSGRAVAVVFGGGGARGFAHIGVMRVLEENGVPVDIVAGTSIGAIMATGPAAEIAPGDYIELAVKRFEKLLDYTLPVVSVLKGKRIARAIESEFGGRDIEDFILPYFCITTNLTTVTADVHRRGDVVTALRASAAIPGVLPPVVIDGCVHTDGGVLNNLPADVMRSLFPRSTIIAIDVAPPVGPPARVDPGLWVSGWRALWHKVRRNRAWRIPVLTDVLVRSTVAASTRDRNRMVAEQVPDLYVPLDMRGVSALEFDAVKPVADRGYEAAKPIIEEWLAGGVPGYGTASGGT